MGRDLLLSQAALAALARMPRAALEAGLALRRDLSASASPCRKIGLCYVLEASGSPQAIPAVEELLRDPDSRVRKEAEGTFARLLAGKGYFWS
jgi:HEAT repeat protein